MPRRSGPTPPPTESQRYGLRGRTDQGTPYAPTRMVGAPKDMPAGKTGGKPSTKGRKK